MQRLSFILFMLIFAASCTAPQKPSLQIAKDQGHLDAGGYSWFVEAVFKPNKKNKIPVEHGMAVGIFSTSDECFLLTSKHVVKGSKRVSVSRWSGRTNQEPKLITATVIYEDPNIDTALLSFPASEYCEVGVIAEKDPLLTDTILLFGQPKPFSGAVSQGIVSGYWNLNEYGTLMISDAVVTTGFSGSGVFDQDNRIVGLVIGKMADDRRGFSYIIPASRLKPIIDKSVEIAMKRYNGTTNRSERRSSR